MTKKTKGPNNGEFDGELDDGHNRPSTERKKWILNALAEKFLKIDKKMRVRFYYFDEGDNYFIEMSEGGKSFVYQVLEDGEFFEDDYLPNEAAEITRPAFVQGVSKWLNMPDFEVDNNLTQVMFSVKQKINGNLDN